MKFSERFYAVLKEKSLDRGWQSAFADAAGISQDALSKIISGKTKSPGIETVSAIIDALGPETFMESPTIHRVGAYSPVEVVEGDNLPRIPIVGEAGAGTPADFFDCPPDSWLPILPLYFAPGLRAFQVVGDSMEPTIMKNSYVGVAPFAGRLNEGGIYLVEDPDFGLVVKRVRKDRNGTLMLFSDNPRWEPIPMPYDGHDNIIAGEVCWVWQMLR